ncbi:MAG: hypothetical protein RI922_115 [Bacteroidota bacterium]|jgi:tetratricopeptide (TPR) repeat protein
MKKTMKNKFIAFAGVVLFSSQVMAQKANETSAAIEYKKYSDAMTMFMLSGGSGDMEPAKKALEKAKGFIDLAAVNETTKESPKTLFYKGEIYTGYLFAFGMDTTFMKENGENYFKTGIESYQKSLAISTKYKEDIKNSIDQKKGLLSMGINKLYDDGKFAECADAYETQARFSEGANEVDTLSIYNAGVCYEKANNNEKAGELYAKAAKTGYKAPGTYRSASACYRKAGKAAEAKAILAEGRKKYPSDRDLLLELVNTNIDAGDAAGAEAALAEAIAADPKNKQLHYTIGTIYIELKQNEKAENALNEALKIDPEYQDALYQLGAHLVTWASDLRTEAGQMKLNDPNYDKVTAKSDETFKRALIPLEKFIVKSPNDKDVLVILSQIYRSVGNYDKSNEYKKRADAIK